MVSTPATTSHGLGVRLLATPRVADQSVVVDGSGGFGSGYFFTRANSHDFIVDETISAASDCTQCPDDGIVTSV